MENITFENHVIRISFPNVRSIDEVKKTIESELGCKIKIISSGPSNLGTYITYKICKESAFEMYKNEKLMQLEYLSKWK